jgi:hypothetical protein
MSARALSRPFARAMLPLRAAASASLALVEAPTAREPALRAID